MLPPLCGSIFLQPLMKKIFIICLLCFITCFLIYCNQKEENKHTDVKRLYKKSITALKQQADSFLLLATKKSSITLLRETFKKARLHYKSIEFLSEYYYPTTSKAINGAPIPEVEADNPDYPAQPSGFQVIEELIFGNEQIIDHSELIVQSKLLQSAITRLHTTAETLELTDAHVWDAIRLQCFRIITLGISGYDSPITQFSIVEASASVKSLLQNVQLYIDTDTANNDKLITALTNAYSYLKEHSNFIAFDRAAFITGFMNPVNALLNSVQDNLHIPYFTEPRPLSPKATSLFEQGAWNNWYYSTNYTKPVNSTALEYLGKELFYEPLLSGNNIRTCGNCHNPEKAFTDGLPKNKSFDGRKIIMRNTPSILFAALQPSQFADTRVSFLEDQAKQVIENPEEMHGNLTTAARKLKGQKKYDSLFTGTFGKNEVTELQIQTAIAAYIRTKSLMNSRFDDYMRGNNTSMNQKEIKGFNLFMGKAKCGTCHFMPLFNGTVPPGFMKIETEVLGVPATYTSSYQLDQDPGKFGVIPSLPYKNSFKTSTARNAALTAPYMHNGSIKTLEALIDFYDRGGGAGLGLSVPNQTLPADPLKLTTDEKFALVAFLKTLTNQ